MALAEKNSDAFVKANARRAEKLQALDALVGEVADLTTRKRQLQNELAALDVEIVDAVAKKQTQARTERASRAVAQAQVGGGEPAQDAIDPTSPEGYAKVMADEALQLKFQDDLDAFFQERIVAVRDALRGMGWEGRAPNYARLYKRDIDGEVQPDFVHVGTGRNVVGWSMNGIQDDLSKTPEDYAAMIDQKTMAELAVRQTSNPPAAQQEAATAPEPAAAQTEPAPIVDQDPQATADREFIQSAIDGKADFYDKAVTDRLAELTKQYTDGDMAALLKQAKTAAKNFFMTEFQKKVA
jgi:hypothetical protein